MYNHRGSVHFPEIYPNMLSHTITPQFVAIRRFHAGRAPYFSEFSTIVKVYRRGSFLRVKQETRMGPRCPQPRNPCPHGLHRGELLKTRGGDFSAAAEARKSTQNALFSCHENRPALVWDFVAQFPTQIPIQRLGRRSATGATP